jgi:hypothetical protein
VDMKATLEDVNPFPARWLTFVSISMSLSLAAQLLDYPLVAAVVVAPAVLALGFAFAGHLITLDDDAPGEFSNPDGDQSVWQTSLSHLIVKFLAFATAGCLLGWYLTSLG